MEDTQILNKNSNDVSFVEHVAYVEKQLNLNNFSADENQANQITSIKDILKYYDNKYISIVENKLNLMDILVDLYQLIGLKDKKIFDLLWIRYNFIKDLESLKKRNEDFFSSLHYENITKIFNMNKIRPYLKELKGIENLYEMQVNENANNDIEENSFSGEIMHLILKDKALKIFLKRTNKQLLNTNANKIKILSYMNCEHYYLFQKFFENAKINSSLSLFTFFKKYYKKHEFLLPMVSVDLYAKKGEIVKIKIKNISFSNTKMFNSEDESQDLIDLVNGATNINFLYKHENIDMEKIKKTHNETRVKIYNSDKMSEEIVQDNSDVYKCIQEFIDETWFLLDLLEQLKVNDFLNEILKILHLNVETNDISYYNVENVQCKYDPIKQYNMIKEHEKIIIKIRDEMPFRSKNYYLNNSTKEVNFNFVGDQKIAESIVKFLRENQFLSNGTFYLFYNGLHLNKNKKLFEKAKVIREIFGDDGFKSLLVNRKKIKKKEATINVYVEGVILNNNETFIKNLYFYNALDIYYNNILSNTTEKILKFLIENSEGVVPEGLFNLSDKNICLNLKNIYESDKNYYSKLKSYVVDFIGYTQKETPTEKYKNNSNSKIIYGVIFGVIITSILGVVLVYILYKFLFKNNMNEPGANSVFYINNKPLDNLKMKKSKTTLRT